MIKPKIALCSQPFIVHKLDYILPNMSVTAPSFHKKKISDLPDNNDFGVRKLKSCLSYLYPENTDLRVFCDKHTIEIEHPRFGLSSKSVGTPTTYLSHELISEAGNYCEQSPVLVLCNCGLADKTEVASHLLVLGSLPYCAVLFIPFELYKEKIEKVINETKDSGNQAEEFYLQLGFFQPAIFPSKEIKLDSFPISVEASLNGVLDIADTIGESNTSSVINDLERRGLGYFSYETEGSECPVIIKECNPILNFPINNPFSENFDILGAFFSEPYGKCHIELYHKEILSFFNYINNHPEEYPNRCSSLKDLYVYVLAHEMMHAFHYSIISLKGGFWDDLDFDIESGPVYETIAEYFALSYCANSNLKDVEAIIRSGRSKQTFPGCGGYSGALRVKSEEQFKTLIDLSISNIHEAFDIIDKSV